MIICPKCGGSQIVKNGFSYYEKQNFKYKECGRQFSAYPLVLPQKRHRAVGKETSLTNHIERFNNTLRQRISRLVRQTLSFSKKIQNHISALLLFINHCNKSLRV